MGDALMMSRRYRQGAMLRITENLENGKTVRLRLDGTISLETFDELAQICAREQQTQKFAVIVVIFRN